MCWLLCRMSVRSAGFAKKWVWKDSPLWTVKNRNGGLARASPYKILWKRYRTHEIHAYGELSKLTREIIDYDASFLYLCCPGDVTLCGKDTLVMKEKPFDQKQIAKVSKDVLKRKFWGFEQVDIEVPKEFYDKLRKMATLFKIYLIVIYLRKWRCIRKKLKEQKNYWVLWKQNRPFYTSLWSSCIWNMVWGLLQFINWMNMYKVIIFMVSRECRKCQIWDG